MEECRLWRFGSNFRNNNVCGRMLWMVFVVLRFVFHLLPCVACFWFARWPYFGCDLLDRHVKKNNIPVVAYTCQIDFYRAGGFRGMALLIVFFYGVVIALLFILCYACYLAGSDRDHAREQQARLGIAIPLVPGGYWPPENLPPTPVHNHWERGLIFSVVETAVLIFFPVLIFEESVSTCLGVVGLVYSTLPSVCSTPMGGQFLLVITVYSLGFLSPAIGLGASQVERKWEKTGRTGPGSLDRLWKGGLIFQGAIVLGLAIVVASLRFADYPFGYTLAPFLLTGFAVCHVYISLDSKDYWYHVFLLLFLAAGSVFLSSALVGTI